MPVSELAKRSGDTIHVDLWYPTVGADCRAVEVHLMCVRAANSLRVRFDHDRNGYVLEMEDILAHESHPNACSQLNTPSYSEVGFVAAWEKGEAICPECKIDVTGGGSDG